MGSLSIPGVALTGYNTFYFLEKCKRVCCPLHLYYTHPSYVTKRLIQTNTDSLSQMFDAESHDSNMTKE